MTLEPDLGAIQHELQTQRSYRAQLIREVRIDVELYNREFEIQVPDDVDIVKAPTTKSVPDRLADRLGSGRFQIHFEPRRAGRAEEQHVEKLEKSSSSIVQLMRKRAKYNPVRAMALHAAVRGAFVPKFQVDLAGFEDAPEAIAGERPAEYQKRRKLWQFRQLDRFPLMLDVRPIECIFPDPETDGENWVIEHYRRKVGDLRKNYPLWGAYDSPSGRDKRGRFQARTQYRDDEQVEYIEVWTREWRAAICNGEWLPIGDAEPGPVPNVLGRPPYWLRYAGFGDPSGEPHQKCVGLIRAMRDVVLAESRLLTVIVAMAEQEAFGAAIVGRGDEAAKETFGYGPGQIIETDHDGSPGKPMPQAYKAQHNMGDALQALSVVQSSSERGSAPNAAIGEEPRNRTAPPSGVAAAIMTGQASMIIDPIKSAIDDFFSDFIPFALYVLDAVVEKELRLYGQVGSQTFVTLTLTQDDIDGHYGPCFVELKLRQPEDDYARWNLGIQALRDAKMPPEWVMERFFGVENGAEMVRDSMAKQIAYSQTVVDNYLIPRLIERLQGKAAQRADAIPGSRTPSPEAMSAGMGAAAMGPGGPAWAMGANGMTGPMDPMTRATLGLAPGAQGMPGGAPVVGTAAA